MGKLRLIGNQLLSGPYKTSKIGAHASSYSWQMKIWNSGPEVSTGTVKTDLWSLGVRAQDDSRGEAEWRVEEQFPCILALAPGHAAKSLQSCPTLCDPMDCSLPGSSVHWIFQAIVLEWIAISFSKGSSQPRDRSRVSRIVDRRFTVLCFSLVVSLGSTPTKRGT